MIASIGLLALASAIGSHAQSGFSSATGYGTAYGSVSTSVETVKWQNFTLAISSAPTSHLGQIQTPLTVVKAITETLYVNQPTTGSACFTTTVTEYLPLS